MTGKTSAVALSTTSSTAVLSNAASSGKVLKVNWVRVTNVDGSASANATVSYYNQAGLGGTQYMLVQLKPVAANSYLDVITKDTPLYLEENTSLGATAGTADDLVVVVGYEEIS
jgi:predicted aminopeptidase